MFIFVEGPDGAGKTTFIESLKHKIGNDAFGEPNYSVVHFGVPEDPTTQVGMYIRAMNMSFKPVVIFDRCWYSDMIYGPVLRGKSGISELDCMLLEEFVRNNRGGLVIYMTADIDTLWNRCRERGEDLIKDIDTLLELSKEYELLMDEIGLPVIRITT